MVQVNKEQTILQALVKLNSFSNIISHFEEPIFSLCYATVFFAFRWDKLAVWMAPHPAITDLQSPKLVSPLRNSPSWERKKHFPIPFEHPNAGLILFHLRLAFCRIIFEKDNKLFASSFRSTASDNVRHRRRLGFLLFSRFSSVSQLLLFLLPGYWLRLCLAVRQRITVVIYRI